MPNITPGGSMVKNLPTTQELSLILSVVADSLWPLWTAAHQASLSGSVPGSGRSPGEGNGNPLQYSFLGKPIDREAWRAAVHGVARVGHDLATKPPPPRSWGWGWGGWMGVNIESNTARLALNPTWPLQWKLDKFKWDDLLERLNTASLT